MGVPLTRGLGAVGACLHARRDPSPHRPPPHLLQSARQSYDVARAARMGTFGLLFYGPYQNWWYGLLARSFPGATVPMFATKVRWECCVCV